ncbi:MAG: 2-phospho-L-lactate transferase [Actinobacteria bacterium]|nr:MAG: 2-phospho-L-lactate transferase [Actinomycetota bacterium]
MRIAVLAGGVGGARFVQALTEVLPPSDVTVIANVGDDLEVHGLHVSPDLDTLLYTLAGFGDRERGWGRAGETWNALDTIERLGGETWFQLGDRDLGLHLVRTEALRRGEPLSSVTEKIARAVGLELALLPATDDRLRTRIRTPAGEFEFQEWFVARGHRDRADEVVYDGAGEAGPAPGVLEALEAAELIAIAPSNPFVSIGPILAIEGIRAAVERRRDRVVAVSPLIGGRAVKGPADAMFTSLAGGTGAGQVTDCYKGLIGALVLDVADADDAEAVSERGVRPLVTRTLMSEPDARAELVRTVLGLVPA